MKFKKITESDSNHDNLELKPTKDLVKIINDEDLTVAKSVKKILPILIKLIDKIYLKMLNGGRLFYIGAGTSGRLGILDASECPPTFGVSDKLVIGLIAGGDKAIRKSQEFAEDDINQGWADLLKFKINNNDSVIGIAASGTTPYVVGAIDTCRKNGILTGCITCNINSPLALCSENPIEVIVGPEVVTGSSRMKAGTAQKLILNTISTTLMVKLGKVKGNKMVDMQLANNKLIDRAEKILMEELKIDLTKAKALLKENKSVRKSLESLN
ncbi:MAG: N-acetylmuramic acid 6-phosphate etherase [Flavobacteriaceae bacterium]|tara:strand:- start:739 stop:1548 length:810 start_codon:yes stop_codon:yes gene_type:complete